jgi:hypothetical protein
LFLLGSLATARSQTALGAFYHRLKARLGPAKAFPATAHKLAKIVYNMLRYGKVHVDLGAAYYEQQYRARVLKNRRVTPSKWASSWCPSAHPGSVVALALGLTQPGPGDWW